MAGRGRSVYARRMTKMVPTLERLKDYWLLGLTVLFMLGATALGATVIAFVLLTPLSLLLGWGYH